MNSLINIDIVKEAYTRFKTYTYYDNFNLILRQQMALFEAEAGDGLEQLLINLTDDLNHYINNGVLNSRIQDKIDNSTYLAVPKSFAKKGKDLTNKILISNKSEDKYIVDKASLLYQGDIEIHLICTIWIILEGVKLHKKIGMDNYGYHMPIDSNTGKFGTEKLLFTKYFEKYQEWRDKGIKAAKSQIEQGNDVMLMSLDVKNFFHSTYIDFDALRKDIKVENSNSLTNLVEIIYKDHTQKLNIVNRVSDLPLLPIGLTSSGVIANWFLSDFDKELKEKTSPVYYGRYVDDIFIVVSNVQSPKIDPEQEEATQIISWLSEKYFYDNIPLKSTVIESDSQHMGFEFTHEKYNGLKIQSDKLKLYYFSPDWPHAMLNKFQKTLEENSSMFWFLPDEEKMEESLDDEAYDMYYEDTINKFRSISDIKASKYGASVFLAKKIKLAVLHNSLPDDKITKEVFRFFKGISKISLYNMWEKVFTFLVVTNDLKSISKLYRQLQNAIRNIDASENKVVIQDTLIKHLNISLQLAVSLNPGILSQLPKNCLITPYRDDILRHISAFRKSLLTRHHYLVYPYLVLTDYYRNTAESVLTVGLFDKLMTSNEFSEKITIDSWKLPRWIHLQEINLLLILTEIKAFKNNTLLFYNKVINSNFETYHDSYITQSLEIFKNLNEKSISGYIQSEKFKQYRDTFTNEVKIFAATVATYEEKTYDKLKIGLSNFKLYDSEISRAISDCSIIDRQKRIKHIKLLNQAEEEKVDLLLLPEVSVPLEWLYAYSDESRRKQRAIVFGLEHFSVDNFCFNLSICMLPFELGKTKECLIIPRLKNHYSPSERSGIQTYGKKVPVQTSKFYHLIRWRNLQFSIYNCYELTDVLHRSIFASELDILFAIEYNRDINYFSNIAESTSRDLHCYFVQANTSNYGDSRVIEPRETIHMNPVRVKGGENNVILKHELDIQKLRNFQIKRLPQQMDDNSFKTTPPDYDHAKVKGRGSKK